MQLTEMQFDALIVRLREFKIRPGLLVTALWQLGWLVPPFALLPILLYLLYYLVIFCVVYAAMLALMTTGRLADVAVFFAVVAGPGIIGLRLAARNRRQAWLAIGALAVIWLGYAIWLLIDPPAIDWDHVSTSRLLGASPGMIGGLMGGLGVSLYRRNRNYRKRGLTWHGLLEQVRVAEKF